MGLWGVLFEIVKTAASHAAPHVARSAVDMARERMNARAEPQSRDAVEQLNRVLAEFDQRIAAEEQRAVAAERELLVAQEDWARKWASARVWIISLLCWNLAITALVLYLVFARR
jgi:negative regulator of replication initiation